MPSCSRSSRMGSMSSSDETQDMLDSDDLDLLDVDPPEDPDDEQPVVLGDDTEIDDESDDVSDDDVSDDVPEHVAADSSTVRRAPHRASSGHGHGERLAWDKERTRELFRRYKQKGDEDAREQLIVNHLNLVRFLASKFKNRGEPLDDLIQVGTIGLIKAIDRFDPERGLEFTTYATPTILGEIKRHFRDKGWSVRVPRRLQELSAKVNQATDALTNSLQRSPSVDEIAKYLEVSVDEVLEAMESSGAYSSVPLEATGTGDDDSPSILDHYATEDSQLGIADDRMVIEDTIKDFSPREQQVIKMRFIDGLTQVEIAQKLGISQVQVSRLLRRTLKKVQEKIDPEGLIR